MWMYYKKTPFVSGIFRDRIKTTVTKISRTDKYEKIGDPIYLVETNVLMQVTKPKISK